MSTFTARTLLLSFLFLLTGAMLFAQSQEEKPTSYARVELSTTPKYVGDSCLVSIVLYGNRPFVEQNESLRTPAHQRRNFTLDRQR